MKMFNPIKCRVDTDNIFLYKKIKYRISNEVKQYEITDNGNDMDVITILERNNKLIFLDGNLDLIDNKYIYPA